MIDLYVSTDGNDVNLGNKAFPLATIEAAQAMVRELIVKGLREPITVHIEEGEYVTKGIVFGSEDSGTKDCPITYIGEGNVYFNGGMTLKPSDFISLNEEEKERLHGDAKDKVVRIDLKKLGLTPSDWGEICAVGAYHTASHYDGAVVEPMWCELFYNDTRMNIARYPNEDYLYTSKAVYEGEGLESAPEQRKMSYSEWEAFRNPKGDIWEIDTETVKHISTWKNVEGVWVFGYPKYDWADASSPIERIDIDKCEMETKYVSEFGIRDQAPYYFFNVFEELDAPGEWFLDRKTGILYLYPISEFTSSKILLSILSDNIVRMEKAAYLTMENITFMGTRGDGLKISGKCICVKNCTIKNVAGNALLVNGEQCLVSGCHIHHVGKGGVLVTGGDRTNLVSSGNIVTNNHLHHIAQIFLTYQPAVDLRGCGHLCSHNCIHDSAHMAIYFKGNNHVMEYNEIYDVCQIADDASAIYAGKDYTTCGNIIRYNYFHDLKSDVENSRGIYGIYFDDNTGGNTIEKNIFLRCQGVIFLHGGHDMNIVNNLIIDGCAKTSCSIAFARYIYWKDELWSTNVPIPEESCHWKSFSEFERNEEIWNKQFPHLKEYFTWEPEEEQSYPHYANICNNIIVNHGVFAIGFPYDEPRFCNNVKNNMEIDSLDGKKPSEIMSEFEDIMLEKAGLL